MTQMALTLECPTPSKVARRGGSGPEQPHWDDVPLYSVEWYRRFRLWHHGRFPDSDSVSRSNLDMLIATAERNA